MWTILSIVAIPVLYYIYTEIKGYFKVQKYIKQGLKHAKYKSLPTLISEMTKAAKSGDTFHGMKQGISEQDPSQPFSAVNLGSAVLINLISEKAIKEFYAKETDNTLKVQPFKTIPFMGFIFENGAHVQDKRAIFSKVFHYSNILNLMPIIRSQIKLHIKKLKQRVEGEGGELKIDFKKEFNRALFDDISACVLLRGANDRLGDTYEGMNVSQIIQRMIEVLNEAKTNPLFFLPYMANLGLVKQVNEMKCLKKGLTEIIRSEYNRRYNQEDLGDKSVLDIMIKLNKESEKETGKAKLTIDEITSNFELFQIAASDTSFQLSSTTLAYLAMPENIGFQRALRKQVDSELGKRDSYSNDELNSLSKVDQVFREAARMANPALSVSRQVSKDFTLDGKTVYKGDMIINPLIYFEGEYFKDPFKFNPDRFDEKKDGFKRAPKLKQIPFSVGKRACLGKYLGEMVVKLILVEILREFELSVGDGFVINLDQKPVYGVTNPDLIIKVRGGE